jgi:hypothetical protein
MKTGPTDSAWDGHETGRGGDKRGSGSADLMGDLRCHKRARGVEAATKDIAPRIASRRGARVFYLILAG